LKNIKNILIPILLLPVLYYACKNDPVTPIEKPLDTARYNWRTDFIPGVIRGIWASDTNNIFFLDIANLDLIKYDGRQYVRYHYSSPTTIDFAGWCINGVSNSEVYIGGDDNRINEPTFGKPQIKRWNGASFETINVPDTFGYYSYISALYTQIPDVIWLGTDKGRVLKYQNGLIEETYIDTSQHIIRFMTDETENLYFLGYRDSCNSNITWCRVFISIFRYDNSGWQRVFYREYEDPQTPIIPQDLGNEIYACDYNAFYKFTGYDYQKTIDIYGFRAGTSEWAGSNSFNIMCLGQIQNQPSRCGRIFHWDGKTWSNENVELFYCEHIIFNCQKQYICSASNSGWGETYIYYGKPKHLLKDFIYKKSE
jgi:hypothetical protein